MNNYQKEKKFMEQFGEGVKKSDIEICGDDATIYTDEGKHFFMFQETEWTYMGSKEW